MRQRSCRHGEPARRPKSRPRARDCCAARIGQDNKRGAEAGEPMRRVGQACFFKQFIELSTWSQAIPALILGNWRSLGGVKMQ